MHFTKMHGLGNDFALISEADSQMHSISQLADRHTAIGFDQAIIISDFKSQDSFFTIKFLNADGSHAGGCGNGTRAAAGYFHKVTGQTDFKIHITLPSGDYDVVEASIMPNDIAKIKMPKPKFSADQIPLSNLTLDPQSLITSHFNASGFCVNVGNPHIVFIVDDCLKIPLETIGYSIETDALFPERINVEFISIINRDILKMRVWERGVGITQACGTGACAAVIAASHQGLINQVCKVLLDGGELDIDYSLDTQTLYMQGAYKFVYEGQLL